MPITPSLQEELKIRGYSLDVYIIKPDQEIDDIKTLIDLTHQKTYKLKRQSTKATLKSSQDFLLSHFNLREVPFTFFEKKLFKTLQKEGTINPLGLSIKNVDFKDPFQAVTREIILFDNPDEPTISYNSIDLPKEKNELTTLSYTHEIAHTELNHVKGLVGEYSNIEVISIFLETLQSYETNPILFYMHDYRRLGDISEIIELLHKYQNTTEPEKLNQVVEMSSYLESTLKAYELFNIYLNGNTQVRKEILTNIQRVFNQEISVETLLNNYSITYESSFQPYKLAKYIKRRG